MLNSGVAPQCLSVSFPHVNLAEFEYIESIKLIIGCGRIESVQRLLDDWDLKIQWDNPQMLILTMFAGHFPSGLPNIDELADFIIVRESAGANCYNAVGKKGMNITATLYTDKAGAVVGAERKYEFSQSELILKRVVKRNR